MDNDIIYYFELLQLEIDACNLTIKAKFERREGEYIHKRQITKFMPRSTAETHKICPNRSVTLHNITRRYNYRDDILNYIMIYLENLFEQRF